MRSGWTSYVVGFVIVSAVAIFAVAPCVAEMVILVPNQTHRRMLHVRVAHTGAVATRPVAGTRPVAAHPVAATHPAPKPKRHGLIFSGPPKLSSQQIQARIHQLSSGRYAVREKAAHELLTMGDAAVPALKAALKGLTTPEMRHLMRGDMRKIMRMDLIRGPLLTLKAKNISAMQAFDDVCSQAGTSANIINSGNLSNISVDIKNAPFWRVMQMLAEKTGVSPAMGYYNNGPGIPLMANGVLQKGDMISYAGAFATVLQNVNYQRNIDLTQPQHPRSSTFSISADLLMLPAQVGTVQLAPVVITKAVDSHGHSLVGGAAPPMYYGQMMGPVQNFQFNLQYPAHPGKRIALLQGYLPLTASTDPKTITLKIPAKGITHVSIPGAKLSVSAATLVNGGWQVTYTISITQTNPQFVAPQQQNLFNELGNTGNMTIDTAHGRVLQVTNFSGGGPFNMASYTLGTNGKPAKISMVIFTGQMNLKVPFKYKNIPMPR